jgi:hypothetical protein
MQRAAGTPKAPAVVCLAQNRPVALDDCAVDAVIEPAPRSTVPLASV